MAEAQYEIRLDANSSVESVALLAIVMDDAREPLTGVSVRFSIEGNGTFASGGLVETETTAFTDDAGAVIVNWREQPHARPHEDVSAVITASCDIGGCEVILDSRR